MSSQMQETDIFKIPIDGLFLDFKNHLGTEGNERVLFSGKFGVGKTYFLNEFFANQEEEYECFHLFPVNYQIASNEDIVEFLKYDILLELSKRNENLFQENDIAGLVDYQRLFYLWGKDNAEEIIKTALSFIPKIGKPLAETAELVESFLDFKNKIKSGEKSEVDTFLNKIKKERILETDYLSELIKEKIKKQKGNKKSVLVLDDLDRIDPKHIFRILNVFSAHFDLKNKEVPNKFGFDRIVLVADMQNLKSIFHHKYGKETDSNGYFDKFFTLEIFQFNNDKIIKEHINDIIKGFKIEDNINLGEAMGEQGYIKILLEDIFKKTIELTGKEKLNLRQLLKGIYLQIPAFKKGEYSKGGIVMETRLRLLQITLKSLLTITGGSINDLILVFTKVKNRLKREEMNDYVYNKFAFVLLNNLKVFNAEYYIQKNMIVWEGYTIKLDIEEEKLENIVKDSGTAEMKSIKNAELFFEILIYYTQLKQF